MAQYITTLSTPLSTQDAFAYMEDLRNLRFWDPGTDGVKRITGRGGVGTEYAVKLSFGSRPVLRYRVTEHEESTRLRFVARNAFFISDDRVEVWEAAAGGAVVRYDARLSLRGPLRWFDAGLRLAFRLLGDRAARGLAVALRADA